MDSRLLRMRIYYHEVMRLRIYIQSDCFSIPKGLRPRFVTVRRIHLQTLRYYSPDRWVFPTCAGISTTDIAPKTASREQNLESPFLHQDIVQSAQRNGLAQRLVCSRSSRNLSRIGPLLPGTVGAPTC